MLNKSGLFIFEEPYLGSMFEKISYDQIYDEHIYMFSVSSIQKIFRKFDMELIDAYPQETHGGSMRYVVARKNQRKVNDSLKNIIKYDQMFNKKTLKQLVHQTALGSIRLLINDSQSAEQLTKNDITNLVIASVVPNLNNIYQYLF